MLKKMGNEELFQLYDKELILRLRNAKNLRHLSNWSFNDSRVFSPIGFLQQALYRDPKHAGFWSYFTIATCLSPSLIWEIQAQKGFAQQASSVVSLRRLNNTATRVIPAKAGIQKVRTVDSVSSTEWHIVWLLRGHYTNAFTSVWSQALRR